MSRLFSKRNDTAASRAARRLRARRCDRLFGQPVHSRAGSAALMSIGSPLMSLAEITFGTLLASARSLAVHPGV
jgi:hypothetical protein